MCLTCLRGTPVDGDWTLILMMRYPFDIVKIVCYWPIMNANRPMVQFNPDQLQVVNHAVTMAEELVSNYFKMSASQWLRPRYDVKTLIDLTPDEVVEKPFAQIIRYQGKRKGSTLGSDTYDFYKICIQDHNILRAAELHPELPLMAFCVYIVAHELIHIVRFSKFLQNFDANKDEKLAEEKRVHAITHDILSQVQLPGTDQVLAFYDQWR